MKATRIMPVHSSSKAATQNQLAADEARLNDIPQMLRQDAQMREGLARPRDLVMFATGYLQGRTPAPTSLMGLAGALLTDSQTAAHGYGLADHLRSDVAAGGALAHRIDTAGRQSSPAPCPTAAEGATVAADKTLVDYLTCARDYAILVPGPGPQRDAHVGRLRSLLCQAPSLALADIAAKQLLALYQKEGELNELVGTFAWLLPDEHPTRLTLAHAARLQFIGLLGTAPGGKGAGTLPQVAATWMELVEGGEELRDILAGKSSEGLVPYFVTGRDVATFNADRRRRGQNERSVLPALRESLLERVSEPGRCPKVNEYLLSQAARPASRCAIQ